jgi:small conductance mechanosensitive channel
MKVLTPYLPYLLALGVLLLAAWAGRGGARLINQAGRFTATPKDDRYWRLAAFGWWGVVGLAVISLYTHIFQLEVQPFRVWGAQLAAWLGSKGITGVLTLALALTLYRLIPYLLSRVPVGHSEEFTRSQVRGQTIKSVLESAFRAVILVVGGLFFLSNLGLNITALVTGVSIAGLAVSFAAQNLVRDFINGFFFLLEDQFGVGDVITVGAISGTVERFNLRITVLRDLEGRVHFLPNSGISVVSVLSRDWARAVVDIAISYRQDLGRALAIFEDEVNRFYHDPDWEPTFTSPPDLMGVQQLTESAIVLRVLFTTKPKEQWAVGREFRKRVAERFAAEKVLVPATQ